MDRFPGIGNGASIDKSSRIAAALRILVATRPTYGALPWGPGSVSMPGRRHELEPMPVSCSAHRGQLVPSSLINMSRPCLTRRKRRWPCCSWIPASSYLQPQEPTAAWIICRAIVSESQSRMAITGPNRHTRAGNTIDSAYTQSTDSPSTTYPQP
jgi:hypothetical protein